MPAAPSTLAAADWLWPFVLLGMALVGLLAASLAWSSATPSTESATASASESAPGNKTPARLPLWLLTLAVPVLVMGLYAALGNPRAINPLERHPIAMNGEAVETLVSRLADRLATQPDDAAGWLMLARSYHALGRYAESAEAWEKARPAAWDDVDSMAEWVEARILAHDQRFDRRSQELLARAMSLNPEHPGVLLLRGLAALDRGDAAAAQKAFTALRNQYPDASPDRDALDQALAQIAAGQDPRSATAGQALDPHPANTPANTPAATPAATPANSAPAEGDRP